MIILYLSIYLFHLFFSTTDDDDGFGLVGCFYVRPTEKVLISWWLLLFSLFQFIFTLLLFIINSRSLDSHLSQGGENNSAESRQYQF